MTDETARPNVDRLLEQAESLRQADQTADAFALFGRVLAERPNHVAANVGAGRCAATLGKLETALGFYTTATRTVGFIWPLMQFAAFCRKHGQADMAETAYRALAELAPERPEPQLGLAACARDRGDRKEAAEIQAWACTLAPEDLAAQVELARDLRQLGRIDDAESIAEAVLLVEPGQKPARTLIDAVARDRLRLDRMTTRKPGNRGKKAQGTPKPPPVAESVQSLLDRAERALKAGDPEAALACCTVAIARAPDQLTAYLTATTALARSGRIAEALDLLHDAAASCADAPALHLRRAHLWRQLGRLDAAGDACRDGLARFPQSFPLWDAAMHLRILTAPGDETTAVVQAARGGSAREQAAVAMLLGDHALLRDDTAGAIGHYQQAAELQPDDTGPRIGLARAFLTRLDPEQAARHLQPAGPPGPARKRAGATQLHFLETVLEDYRSDPGAVAALASLPEDAPARLQGLLPLVRAFPESTLLAAALLDAAAELALSPADFQNDRRSPIPRRVIQYWDRPPPDLLALMTSWRSDSFDYLHLDASAARAFLGQHHGTTGTAAFDRCATEAARADLMRLIYLAEAGGIYTDAFSRRLADPNPLLSDDATLILCRGELGLLGTGLMAAAPGNAVLRRAARQALVSAGRGDRDLLWLASGPGLLTRCFAQELAENPAELGPMFRTVRVWSRREMNAHAAMNCLSDWRATLQSGPPARSRMAAL
jgi:tetratricopeptide (TPR) repeat protein